MTVVIPLDFLSASVQKLQAFPAFQALVLEGLIGTDADDTDSDVLKLSRSWLFQGLSEGGAPYRDPEGSSTGVVVLRETPEWSVNAHNTMRFPSLQMMVYADSTRNEDGAVVVPDAEAKAKHIARMLDRCFHLPSNQPEDRRWPGPYRVHTCIRTGGMSIEEVPGTGGMTKRCIQTYEATMD